MGILSYINEQKSKFRAKQELVSEQRAVSAAKEAETLKARRLVLEKRDKQYKALEREQSKLNKLEAREISRRKANSAVGKVAGFLQGARKELSAMKSDGANPWRDGSAGMGRQAKSGGGGFLGAGSSNTSGAFTLGRQPEPVQQRRKAKRREVPKAPEAYNPWR